MLLARSYADGTGLISQDRRIYLEWRPSGANRAAAKDDLLHHVGPLR